LLEITNHYVYVFCSAEGLWKAEENVQILYSWGAPTPNYFNLPK